MKLFISSSRENRELVRGVMDKLEVQGYQITCRWPELTDGNRAYTGEELKQLKNRLHTGIEQCELYIFILPGGINSHCELTTATLLDKPCYIVAKGPADIRHEERDWRSCPWYFAEGVMKTYSGDMDVGEFLCILLATHSPEDQPKCEECG